jgi:hypothetical protein
MTAAVAAPVVSRTCSSVNPIVSVSHNLPFPFPQLFHSWVGLENYLASACDVCCDLRRRRRRRKKSFLDTGSIGTLRKTLRKLVLEKQKISFSGIFLTKLLCLFVCSIQKKQVKRDIIEQRSLSDHPPQMDPPEIEVKTSL